MSPLVGVYGFATSPWAGDREHNLRLQGPAHKRGAGWRRGISCARNGHASERSGDSRAGRFPRARKSDHSSWQPEVFMSPGAVEALVLHAYGAYNRRELEHAAAFYSEDVELRNVATGDVIRGRTGYLQHVSRWTAAFPDSSLEVVQLEVTGPAATAQLISRGTHTGTLLGDHGHIPPTWAQIEVPLCEVLRMEDGLISTVDSYHDTGTMLRQMGLFPNSPLHQPDRRATLDLYALDAEATPEQRNKAVVQKFIDRVVNSRQPGAAADVCAPNMAWHGGPMGEVLDLPSYQRHLARLFTAFPDLEMQVVDVVAEADRVAIRSTLAGTHRGEFHGIRPTGKRVTHTGASTYRVVDGHIVEEWWDHDLFGILQQLHGLPVI